MKADEFKLEGLAVDSAPRRCNPACNFSRFGDGLHQGLNKGLVFLVGKPLVFPLFPFLHGNQVPLRIRLYRGELPYLAVKSTVREAEAKVDTGIFDGSVPASYAKFGVIDVIISKAFVD